VQSGNSFRSDKRTVDTADCDHEDYRTSRQNIYENAMNIMLFEEFSELQKELCKALRHQPNYDAISEEIADCEIFIRDGNFIFIAAILIFMPFVGVLSLINGADPLNTFIMFAIPGAAAVVGSFVVLLRWVVK